MWIITVKILLTIVGFAVLFLVNSTTIDPALPDCLQFNFKLFSMDVYTAFGFTLTLIYAVICPDLIEASMRGKGRGHEHTGVVLYLLLALVTVPIIVYGKAYTDTLSLYTKLDRDLTQLRNVEDERKSSVDEAIKSIENISQRNNRAKNASYGEDSAERNPTMGSDGVSGVSEPVNDIKPDESPKEKLNSYKVDYKSGSNIDNLKGAVKGYVYSEFYDKCKNLNSVRSSDFVGLKFSELSFEKDRNNVHSKLVEILGSYWRDLVLGLSIIGWVLFLVITVCTEIFDKREDERLPDNTPGNDESQ